MKVRSFLAPAFVLAGILVGSVAIARQNRQATGNRDFPLAGGNLTNQRHSTLTQITPADVARLGGAWMIHVADGQTGGGNMAMNLTRVFSDSPRVHSRDLRYP